MSNNIVIADREFASGLIEGVDFGPKVWVIARSPEAVLLWVFGHSWSVNGHQRYSEPHLTLLANRSPSFKYHPTYKNYSVSGNRLKMDAVDANALAQIGGALGIGIGEGYALEKAVQDKRTLIINGGGGSLLPLHCYGEDYREWKARGGGFIVYPEMMTEKEKTDGEIQG